MREDEPAAVEASPETAPAKKGLAASEGERATVEGTAADAKLGAVVMNEAGVPVFVGGLESWPTDVHGKRVRATGLLVKKELGPPPAVADDGAVSAGMAGPAWVLEGADWAVLEP